jgi:predicted transglutaminase-like cysteine proteinase
MSSFYKSIAVVLACVFAISNANAALFSFPQGLKRQADQIQFDQVALAPLAYMRFCAHYDNECQVHHRAFHRPRPVELSDARWRDLVEVNRVVNRSIAPKAYLGTASYDTWRIDPQAGDCNDYAVSKRHELLARGWPSRALLLSEVVTSWGEHHMILVVRTAERDVVLDNLNANIRVWSKTGYQWVRIQTPAQPNQWSTIRQTAPRTLS